MKKPIPQEYHDRVIKTILNNEDSLGIFVKEFDDNYKAKNWVFINYLHNIIIDEIGTEVFVDYVKTRIKEYAKKNVTNDASAYTWEKLWNVVFGYHWDFRKEISIRKNGKCTTYRSTLVLLLRAFLPYAIRNVHQDYARENYYDLLNFNPEQRNEYEKIYKSIPQEYHDRVINTILTKEESLKALATEFNDNYKTQTLGFMKYLDDSVIYEVGEEEFLTYVETILKQYDEKNVIKFSSAYTWETLLDVMFGYHWDFRAKFELQKNGKYISYRRVLILLLRAFLPYAIRNVHKSNGRKYYYDVLNLNSKERDTYEKIYESLPKTYSDASLRANKSTYNKETMILGEITIEKLLKSISEIVDEEALKSRNIASLTLRKITKSVSDTQTKKYLNHIINNPSINNYVNKEYHTILLNKQYELYCNNKDELKETKDSYILYSHKNNKYIPYTIKFSEIKSEEIKQELIYYLRYVFKTTSDTNYYEHLMPVITMIKYMEEKFKIENSSNISHSYMLAYMSHLEIEKKLSPLSLKTYKAKISNYFDFLINSENIVSKPLINPSNSIILRNTEDHVNTTGDIPEEIFVFLATHIHEVNNDAIELMYKIFLETGWRYSEVAGLTIDALETRTDTGVPVYIIKTTIKKTRKARIVSGLGEYLTSAINKDLYNDIEKYIESTEKLRNKYATNLLFFYIEKGLACKISSPYFNRQINNILKKHNVTTLSGDAWVNTSKNFRKHVAIEMISNDATLTEVQLQLGHTQAKTTAQYYAAVKMKKIAELNSPFFQEKFNMLIDEDKLSLYSEEERKILYIDFMLGTREVELGQCLKHPSEGRCSINGNMSCSTCANMCTGALYLPKWEKLAEDSLNLLNQFKSKYEELNIPEDEYQNFIEYKQELKLYNQYLSVIDAIKKKGV